MKAQDTLYKLLHWALVEIRYEATEVKSNKIFSISNALHNLPLQLLTLEQETDYETLLSELEEQIKNNEGLSGLLAHVRRTAKNHDQDK
ncbi:hypothetical protein J2I47_08000 [Fibrella sp. HMF5335]|uniref:Uncharacterized protein n=1 Tax=Fibrella rubiginis TaxID=2817060 RepID=A0A939GHB5_9BACT|nr:hypothetical protein [Fibrella rubiginis]MBO0936482.1 hypothetical protein [Fibrella rubiginis]